MKCRRGKSPKRDVYKRQPVACVVIAGFLLVVLFGGMSPDKTFGQEIGRAHV